MPGRGALLDEGGVGVVEHDRGAQVRDGGERGDAAAEHHARPAAGGLPGGGAGGGGVVAGQLDGDPAGGLGGGGEAGPLGRVGGYDDRRPLDGEERHDEVAAGPRRGPHHEPSGPVREGERPGDGRVDGDVGLDGVGRDDVRW